MQNFKQPWNHYYVIDGEETMKPINSPGFCVTKGKRIDELFEKYDLTFKGKKVMDIGASDGYFCIKAAQLGAVEVQGVEPDPLRIQKALYAQKCLNVKNVSFYQELLGDWVEKVKVDGNPLADIVMALGFLHRVPDINLALGQLSGLTSSGLLLEFKTLNSSEPELKYHGGDHKLNKLNALYYTPSISYVERFLKERGFQEIFVDKDETSHLNYKRTLMYARK